MFKTSTWFKNDYSRYIGGSRSLRTLRSYAGQAITSPGAVVPFTMAQWSGEYSVPMFGSLTRLDAQQAQEYLTQLEQQKNSLEKALIEIQNIDTVEKWEQLKLKPNKQQRQDNNQLRT